MKSHTDVEEQKVANRNEPTVLEKDKITPDSFMESDAEITNTSALSEHEVLKSSGIIIGLCTDMCPGVSLNYYLAKPMTNGCHFQPFSHYLVSC